MQNYGGGIQIPIESILELIPGTPGYKRNAANLAAAKAAEQQALAAAEATKQKTPIEVASMLEANSAARNLAADRRRAMIEGASAEQAKVNEAQLRMGIEEMLAPLQAQQFGTQAKENTARAALWEEQKRLLGKISDAQMLGELGPLFNVMAQLQDRPVMDAKGRVIGYETNPLRQQIMELIQKYVGPLGSGTDSGSGAPSQPALNPDQVMAAIGAARTGGSVIGDDWISRAARWLGTQTAGYHPIDRMVEILQQQAQSGMLSKPIGPGRRGF